jgi:ABA sandwich protein
MNAVKLAGRNLDCLVAEKVMQKSCMCVEGGMPAVACPIHDGPHYSTDIAAAWSVVEKLAKPLKVVWTGKVWVCEIFGEPYSEEAGTAPLAICRAVITAELKMAKVGA